MKCLKSPVYMWGLPFVRADEEDSLLRDDISICEPELIIVQVDPMPYLSKFRPFGFGLVESDLKEDTS